MITEEAPVAEVDRSEPSAVRGLAEEYRRELQRYMCGAGEAAPIL
jgi:hypothetical protein